MKESILGEGFKVALVPFYIAIQVKYLGLMFKKLYYFFPPKFIAGFLESLIYGFSKLVIFWVINNPSMMIKATQGLIRSNFKEFWIVCYIGCDVFAL